MRSHLPFRVFTTALVLSALVLLGIGCRGGNDANAVASDVTTVTVGSENIVVASAGELTSGPALSGTLMPAREASVRAQVSGSVLQTYVDEGQTVRAGTLIAQLEAAVISDAVLSARSGVALARSSVNNATRELARAERLHAAGAIAERELEQARWSATNARASLADAQARLAAVAKQLSNTAVRAPFGGVVSAKSVSAGDVVQPGTALFTIVDPSSMRLEATVPVEQLGDLRIGLSVSFTVSGYGERRFQGNVLRINPVVDPATRQARITVALPNIGGTLVGGLFATGRLATSTRSGLVVPTAAVDERGATPTVLRVRQGKVERIPVILGVRDEAGERIEVAGGLESGDTLLIGAARGVAPGTAVRIAPRAAWSDTRIDGVARP